MLAVVDRLPISKPVEQAVGPTEATEAAETGSKVCLWVQWAEAVGVAVAAKFELVELPMPSLVAAVVERLTVLVDMAVA
jgi:hypothetical protein